MTTDTQQTAEAATATADTATTQSSEPTLDDVYREVAPLVEQQARQQQETKQETKTTEAPKVEPSSVPDPYDTENFKAFLARQANGTTELHKAFQEVRSFLTAQQQKSHLEALKADVDRSVKAIDEVAQIGKPKVIEAYLDGMVREDTRMKALWDNRAKNPQAWGNALKIVAKKMAEEFSVKVDPDLQKSQRALKEAKQQMATTSDKEGPDQSWDGISQEEFDRRWQKTVSGWS